MFEEILSTLLVLLYLNVRKEYYHQKDDFGHIVIAKTITNDNGKITTVNRSFEAQGNGSFDENIKTKRNHLRLPGFQSQLFLEHGNQNIIAGCNKSPEEKYANQHCELRPPGLLIHLAILRFNKC